MAGVRKIGFVVPPMAQAIDVSGPIGAFQEANRQSNGTAAYEMVVLSIDGSDRVEIDGMRVLCDRSLSNPGDDIDTLLVAGSHEFKEAYAVEDVLHSLRLAVRRVRRYGSVCTGAFYLAAAGLLDGCRATTHWEHASELAQRHPSVDVLPDSIFVKDGPLYTSAGITAGIDLALHFIEEDHGRELALKVARRLVVFLRRQGGQSQYSAYLAGQTTGHDRIQRVQHWILENVDGDLSLKSMAREAAMSVRNFSRVFKHHTGETPADFVELVRVDEARRLLQESGASLQRIAIDCGFTNADIMRRAFLRRRGIGPTDYRERFHP